MTLTPEVNNPPQSLQADRQSAGRKVSVPWTGGVLALGGLVSAVGTFLPFEKIVAFHGHTPVATATFTGLGSESRTGLPINGLKAGNAGMIILIASAVAVVCGLVIVANHGRVWARVVGLLAALAAGVLCLASFAAAKSDQKDLNASAQPGWSAHALSKLGADIATVGVGVAVVGAVLALFIRRRRAA